MNAAQLTEALTVELGYLHVGKSAQDICLVKNDLQKQQLANMLGSSEKLIGSMAEYCRQPSSPLESLIQWFFSWYEDGPVESTAFVSQFLPFLLWRYASSVASGSACGTLASALCWVDGVAL